MYQKFKIHKLVKDMFGRFTVLDYSQKGTILAINITIQSSNIYNRDKLFVTSQ